MDKLGITAGAVVAVTLVGIAGAASCDTPSPDKPAHSQVKVVPSPVQTPMSKRIKDWYVSVTPELNAVVRDLNDASNAASAYSTDDIVTICGSGVIDTMNLASKNPYPGNPALWNHMLVNLDNAFTSCENGEYDTASLNFSKVTSDLQKLEADVNKYK